MSNDDLFEPIKLPSQSKPAVSTQVSRPPVQPLTVDTAYAERLRLKLNNAEDDKKPRKSIMATLLPWLLAASVALNLFFVMPSVFPDGIVIIDDGGKPGPSIDGIGVVLVEDERSNPREKWSPRQTIAADAVVKWAMDNAGKLESGKTAWISIDRGQDLSRIDPVWRDVVAAAEESPPSVLVIKGSRILEFRLPEDPDKALELLETAAK